MPAPSLEHDNELLAVRAAELYYEENKTQDEIGSILRITRWKVGRLLAAARDQGIIRIEIVHPKARRLGMEHELVDAYSLESAIVIPREDDENALNERVAASAADFLVSMRPRTHRLGVGWGKTLHLVANALPVGWSNPVQVVQLNGGVSRSVSPDLAATTASAFARKSGGHVTLLPIPSILEQVETKRAIEADRSVRQVLAQAENADTFLFSAGPTSERSIHLHSGYIDLADIARLQAKGAVGDVLGRYITAEGGIADPELDERTLGLSLDKLRSAQRSIAVVAGHEKHRVAHAIVSNGLATTIITDEDTAQYLLESHSTKVTP
jgi:deoxyribonucleoside regulator